MKLKQRLSRISALASLLILPLGFSTVRGVEPEIYSPSDAVEFFTHIAPIYAAAYPEWGRLVTQVGRAEGSAEQTALLVEAYEELLSEFLWVRKNHDGCNSGHSEKLAELVRATQNAFAISLLQGTVSTGIPTSVTIPGDRPDQPPLVLSLPRFFSTVSAEEWVSRATLFFSEALHYETRPVFAKNVPEISSLLKVVSLARPDTDEARSLVCYYRNLWQFGKFADRVPNTSIAINGVDFLPTSLHHDPNGRLANATLVHDTSFRLGERTLEFRKGSEIYVDSSGSVIEGALTSDLELQTQAGSMLLQKDTRTLFHPDGKPAHGTLSQTASLKSGAMLVRAQANDMIDLSLEGRLTRLEPGPFASYNKNVSTRQLVQALNGKWYEMCAWTYEFPENGKLSEVKLCEGPSSWQKVGHKKYPFLIVKFAADGHVQSGVILPVRRGKIAPNSQFGRRRVEFDAKGKIKDSRPIEWFEDPRL